MFSKKSNSSRIASLGLALAVGVLTASGQQPTDSVIPSDQKSADQKSADQKTVSATKKALAMDENPELIGKRDINNNQLNFYSLEKETALGRRLAAEIDREARFVTDPLIQEYVNRVGQNIVLHSDAKVPFTIKVIDTEEVNAFALPGGFFYVNKGLILEAESEAEVAGVMAHEIAHVAARHGVEQASKGALANYASIPLIFLGGWGGFAVRQAAGLAVPMGFLKFSRGAEEEADSLGAQYLWSAGYDPHAMVSFFEKLQAKDNKKPGKIGQLFGTHPATGDRIEKVSALVARFPDRSEYAVSSSEFDQVKSRLVEQTNAHRATIAQQESRRPTLKRRPAAKPADEGSGDQTTDSESKRPTLRRQSDSQ